MKRISITVLALLVALLALSAGTASSASAATQPCWLVVAHGANHEGLWTDFHCKKEAATPTAAVYVRGNIAWVNPGVTEACVKTEGTKEGAFTSLANCESNTGSSGLGGEWARVRVKDRCFKVAQAGTGLYSEAACLTDVAKSEFILGVIGGNLNLQVSSGVFCVRVGLFTGLYTTPEACHNGGPHATAGTGSFAQVKVGTQICASIHGSGSSLQNLAQKSVWTVDWPSFGWLTPEETLECEEAPEVSYEPTSSGKGLGSWGSKNGSLTPSETFNKESLDEFVGTDVGPEGPATTAGTQIFNMDVAGGDKGGPLNGVVTFPVAQSAVTVIISLPIGCKAPNDPGVSNNALSKAWLTGAVNFLALVPGTTGSNCDNKALLEAREAASGTTAGFKRYLLDLEPALWKPCNSTAVESESPSCWGTKAPDESGNETGGKLAAKVLTTLGTIGYADLADARAQGFPTPGTPIEHESYLSFIALVPNDGAEVGKEGTTQNPEITEAGPENEGANCKKASYPVPGKVAVNEDWSKARQENATKSEEGVYPICTLTFDVAWQKYSLVAWTNAVTSSPEKYSKEQYATTFNYLRWLISEGEENAQAEELAKGHFLALPTSLITEDKAGVTMKNIFFTKEGE